ncbi:MAG: hypothetical protein AB8E82_16895, partial [Aureispira sp.]
THYTYVSSQARFNAIPFLNNFKHSLIKTNQRYSCSYKKRVPSTKNDRRFLELGRSYNNTANHIHPNDPITRSLSIPPPYYCHKSSRRQKETKFHKSLIIKPLQKTTPFYTFSKIN